MKTKRLVLFFICMAAFSAAFYIGSVNPVPMDEAQAFDSQFKQEYGNIDAMGIFTHNTTIALGMFIPVIGMIFGVLVGNMTGTAYSAVTTLAPGISTKIPALALLFLSPFGIMEVVSYSIGMSRSIILINAARKHQLRKEIRPTLIEIGIVVSMLLVAGFVEYYMIQNNSFKVGLH